MGHAAGLFTCDAQVRVFVVVAKYCATAVWEDERKAIFDGLRKSGLLSPRRLAEYFAAWWYAIKDLNLFSHFSVLQEIREIILWAYCLGMVHGRPGANSKVHCMVRGFMSDRVRRRSQSCRWVDLTGALHAHFRSTILINVDHRVSETSSLKNYDSVARADRMINTRL
jgi:hypothetical protein